MGLANIVLKKFLQGVDDMLPARVVSYDKDTNRATLAPMVALLTTAGSQVARAQVASVPVFRFGGGGVLIRCPVKAGDLGWIKACDRDISMFLQSFGSGPPNTVRLHTFQDAMFFPDALRTVVVDPDDDEALTIQTEDGQFRVAVAVDRVTLTAAGNKFEMTAAGVNYTGGPFNINGIPFGTHRHPETGGTTLGPIA